MKGKIFLLFLLFVCTTALGQSKFWLRADSVFVTKIGGYADLIVRNNTMDTLGIATNIAGGLIKFKRPYIIDDSTFVVGNDTLVLHGGQGGLDINEVNAAIDDAIDDLPIHFDSVLFINDGSIGAAWSLDTTNWIETKYHSQYLIDSLGAIVDAITLAANGGGIVDEILNTGSGDTLVVKVNDSTYNIKSIIAGTNVTFTVTGNDITINAATGTTEINAISITASGTVNVTVSDEAMIEYVNVDPATDIGTFSVGTLSDDDLYYPPTPVLAANGITTFDVDAYLSASTAVYFYGSPASTDIQIVFKLIHE